MMEIKETMVKDKKKELRRKILLLRDGLSAEDRRTYNGKIKERMTQLSCYREAEVILTYVNYRSEVDTSELIVQAIADGKQVFTPKVKGTEMEFWQIKSLKELHSGYRGILEPPETLSYPAYRAACTDREGMFPALMWMPGAVFDRACHRIGYGGGFYDKYLDGLRSREVSRRGVPEEGGLEEGGPEHQLTVIALAYGCQILDRIPFEAHDHRPDYILTEQELIKRTL